MAKTLSHEQAMQKYVRLMAKINRYVDARAQAEEAFEKLKYGPKRIGYDTTPEWKAVCKASGTHECCDFGDLSC